MNLLDNTLRWAKKNFFNSIIDSIITLFILFLMITLLPSLFNWLIFDATFTGDSREACNPNGACWLFISFKLKQFIYGFYPDAQIWRINIVFVLFACNILGFVFVSSQKLKNYLSFTFLIILPLISFYLLNGGEFGLEKVETSQWGGLTVTLIIATVGIVASLPLGIVLALGRRSDLPIIKWFSVTFIELWRGIPLITVLFMSSVMLPLFLNEGTHFNKLLRVLIGVSIFSGAYMSEVIRGGLQAIPKGQNEAAIAIGLSYWQTVRFIILPQAIKKVIPGIVNSFISLFKDTTLVLVVGMFDLLGIIEAASTDSKWLGYVTEGYLFSALIFWIFCYSMSKYSQNIEKKLKTSY